MEIRGVSIALTGEMRSGKDTVGQYLIEEYGFKRFAFGDGIRKTTQRLFPEMYEQGEKPRKLLQDFGEFCRTFDQNVWVNYLFREMLWNDIDPLEDNVVITDLRQPHEYDALLEAGFTIVRVNTKPHIRKQRIISSGERFDQEAFQHDTEKHVREFEVDYELNNNGTPDQLLEQVDAMIQDITGGGV